MGAGNCELEDFFCHPYIDDQVYHVLLSMVILILKILNEFLKAILTSCERSITTTVQKKTEDLRFLILASHHRSNIGIIVQSFQIFRIFLQPQHNMNILCVFCNVSAL